MLNTHSKYGDCRIESLIHSALLAGVSFEKVKGILDVKASLKPFINWVRTGRLGR
jgi:hypothetical protein